MRIKHTEFDIDWLERELEKSSKHMLTLFQDSVDFNKTLQEGHQIKIIKPMETHC